MNLLKEKTTPIRHQLLFLAFAFSLAIGLIITAASYLFYHNYLEDSLIRATDTNLLYLADYMDNELNNIDQLILYCKSDSDIVRFVESNSLLSTQKLDAYEALADYCMYNSSSAYLARVVITNQVDSYIQVVPAANSSTINVAKELPKQDFYPLLLKDDYIPYSIGFMTDNFSSGKDSSIVPLLQPISHKFNSKLGGYIFIQVSAGLFADAMRNIYQENAGELYLTLGEKSYIIKDGTFYPAGDAYSYIGSSSSIDDRPSSKINTIRRDDGSKYIVVSEELSHSGCYVSQMLSEDDINAGLPLYFMLILFLFIALFFVSFLLNHILGKIINTPVQQIKARLIQIADGDFTRDTSIEWNHEFGDIGKGVNELALNIKALLDETLEDEKQKRDLEYKVLQSQINPHFLYNTLNSIKWMASIQGATGITEMTTALSHLLKSISKGTKLLIPLSEEINLLKDYFTIQQYRYGGTIHLNVNVEEDLYSCHIIKFTLQPLVENAIFHGIEPTGVPGTITVSAYSVSDTNMQIDITDTGVGMTQETIACILAEQSVNTSDFFKELGVSNVHKRLQYEFGSAYGITIDSKLGEYTTMSILIPKQFQSTK